MIGLIIANLWAISPRLEGGWPVYLPGNEHGGYDFGIPLQPFEGGWAWVARNVTDSIYIIGWDGRAIPPWPLSPGAEVTIHMFSLCLGDINRDGSLDVVYSGCTGAGGCIYAHDIETGGLLPGWPANFNNPVYRPSLWDIDGDGFPEVIAVEYSFIGNRQYLIRVHIIDHDGLELPGWPREFQGATYPSLMRPALGDPDQDGITEVVLPAGDRIIMLDAYGNIKPGWPFLLGQGLPPEWMETCSFVALADLDGDRVQEIILSTYTKDTTDDTLYLFPDTSRLFALSVDGSPRPGWPLILEQVGCSFIPADVDGDGLPEIFVIKARLDEHDRWRHTFLFLGSQGEVKFSFQEPPYRHFINFGWRGAADTDGDGAAEIIFSGIKFRAYEASMQGNEALKPSETGLIALDRFGRETWNIRLSSTLPPDSLSNPYSFWTGATPSFSDVDGDGFLELSHDFSEMLGEGCGDYYYHVYLYTWEVPGITSWRIDWSGPSHDSWNTNNYDFWPDNPSLVRESAGKPRGLVLLVFPNPGKDIVTMNLEVRSPSDVLLEAYDPVGRLVHSENLGILEAGSHRITLDLGPGVYFLRARAGNESGLIKAILTK